MGQGGGGGQGSSVHPAPRDLSPDTPQGRDRAKPSQEPGGTRQQRERESESEY